MHRFRFPALVFGLAALGLAFAVASRAEKPTETPEIAKLNKKIDPFSLPGSDGKTWSLSDQKEKKAIVLVFVSFECPVSNSYAPTLATLHKNYSDKGVAFVAVNSSDDVSVAEIAKQAKELALPFPVLADDKHKTADLFKAGTAPEVFVLDHNHLLRYRGRIDDTYSARLKKSAKVSSHDLKNALEDLLAGKAVRKPFTEPIGCPIQRERVTKVDGKVTYYRDVLPILQAQCQQCHRPGEVGPFSLMTYKQAVNWASDIKDYTADRRMPPFKAIEGGPFHNERRLSDKEIKTLAEWADNGTPSGNPADAPKPVTFVDGWQLGKPDLILTMPEEMTIGPAGNDVFRCVVMPTGLKEDKTVIAVEVRPGNKRVVHHSLNFFDTSGTARAMERKEQDRKKKPDEQDFGPGYGASMGIGFVPIAGKVGGIGGWAPGQRARFLPEGYGYPLPAGSDIVMQLHYHRNGRTEKDKTSIGLYFAKKPAKPYKNGVIRGNFLVIPPNTEKFQTKGAIEAGDDGLLHSVMPHMHMLGRSIKVTMTPPDGKARTLVTIADWDYNWQETYFPKQPIPFKKGTRFSLEAIYDNSAKNPNNPFNPPQWVRFGEQTDNEMCFVFLGVTNDAPGRFPFTRVTATEKKP